MAEVYFTKPGHGDLLDLPGPVRDRVEQKLRRARKDPERWLKPLRGYDLYVLRVGDYRAICDWDRSEGLVYVHAIGHRRNVYDRGL